jgi:enediyne biosynthesis protein E4
VSKEIMPVEFVDVTSRAGISWGAKQLAPGLRYLIETMGGGGGFLDYNNDGLLDIYLVSYTQPESPDAKVKPRDTLYRNNGDGTFADVTEKAGVNNRLWGAGAAFFDADGDGQLDLFVTNCSQQTNAFWHNNGDGTFSETTYEMGLGRVSLPMSGFGTRFFDYNNDGLVDLFVHNGHPFEPIQKVFPETTYAEPPFLFENTGKAMRDVAAEHGAALKKHYLGRGLAVGDIDNDGDSDLLLVNAGEPPVLLRNDGGNRNNWLGLRLVGSKSNRDAVGARVTIRVGAARRVKQMLGGASYLSASDMRLLWGLGGDLKVDDVEVRWPSGTLTRLKDVASNRYLVVREEEAASSKR